MSEALKANGGESDKADEWSAAMSEAKMHRELHGMGTDEEARALERAEASGGENEAKARDLEQKANWHRDQYGPGTDDEHNLRRQAEALRNQ
jgi:hypothetical protein